MPPDPVALEERGRITLVETLDRVLHKGAVIAGDVTLSVADVDLIFVGLRVLVSSVETARTLGVTGERRGAALPGGCGATQGGDGQPPVFPDRAQVPVALPAGTLREGSAIMREAACMRDDSVTESHVEARPLPRAAPARMTVRPEQAEHGLARLVLTLIDLLRRLLEKQALRRVEGGSLSAEEVERMGLTFQRLEEKMGELKAQFGLSDQDLTLDLGPLGDLL